MAGLAILIAAIVLAKVFLFNDVETRTNPIDGAKMVFVPAGEFLMGSDDGEEGRFPRLPLLRQEPPAHGECGRVLDLQV